MRCYLYCIAQPAQPAPGWTHARTGELKVPEGGRQRPRQPSPDCSRTVFTQQEETCRSTGWARHTLRSTKKSVRLRQKRIHWRNWQENEHFFHHEKNTPKFQVAVLIYSVLPTKWVSTTSRFRWGQHRQSIKTFSTSQQCRHWSPASALDGRATQRRASLQGVAPAPTEFWLSQLPLLAPAPLTACPPPLVYLHHMSAGWQAGRPPPNFRSHLHIK